MRFLAEVSVVQLNQDFDLIRQKIIAGERPKFDDVTAPAESVFFLLKCPLHFDALQVPGALQVMCAPRPSVQAHICRDQVFLADD